MNNYEYVQRLKQNIEEQEKLKTKLKQTLNYLSITEEEKEKIITNLLSIEIETYKPTTILPFQKYIKIKLEKEINKLYFTPSTIIPIEEQKIIYLYLNQSQNHFLTEEEIRTNLHTDSKKIYLALKKLRPTSTQEKEELTKLFPNYKQQLKKRHSFFNQTTIISEKDLEYLGYYIGEINDICLDINEIAKKEEKPASEIEKSLKSTFKLLKNEKNIELIKTRYPNCEKMLQIKATNFGIELNLSKEEQTEKKEHNSHQKQKQPKLKKEASILTKQQETLLKELAKNPNIKKEKLVNLTGYKNKNSIWNTLNKLKKKCETNEKVKEKVLELYPNFLEPKQKKQQTVKQERPLLTKNQETLLKELAKNPNIKKEELAKLIGYKNKNSICVTLNTLKKKCETNEKVKEKVLELYPNFLEPKQKKQQTVKQERPLLAKKREALLKELAKNPNIAKKELAKIIGYKNQKTLMQAITILKKKCETNEKIKEKVLELYPDFLNPKPKPKQTKKPVLTNQELQILQSIYLITPPTTSYITYKQLSMELYYSEQNIHHKKNNALEKIESNPKIKEELQKNWPSFEQDKIIREQYKKGRSIKIPSQDIERIKSFIRQDDIPENNVQKEKRNNILIGIHNLENSIFSSYVSKCTEEQKAMLALRLGFINAPATTEIVAELFGVEQQEVITLTKNCLQSAKPTLTAKTYQKKKEN